MRIIHKISNWLNSKKINSHSHELNEAVFQDRNFTWCIIGNIVDYSYWGEQKILRRGTKQHRPGTKVYCLPEFNNSEFNYMRTIGKPRKSIRLIEVIIDTRKIKNFRVQKIYSPKLKKRISEHWFYKGYCSQINETQELQSLADFLNSKTTEIKTDGYKG